MLDVIIFEIFFVYDLSISIFFLAFLGDVLRFDLAFNDDIELVYHRIV